jgi:hypothetical protein
MMLSPHFSLDEFTHSETALRLGIDNTPSAEIVANLTRVAHALETIRTRLHQPIHISSGYRCQALNIAIGGSKTSKHMDGLAADFTCHDMSVTDTCRAIRDLGEVDYDQLIHEFSRWVHLGLAPFGMAPRRDDLTTAKSGVYTAGLP